MKRNYWPAAVGLVVGIAIGASTVGYVIVQSNTSSPSATTTASAPPSSGGEAFVQGSTGTNAAGKTYGPYDGALGSPDLVEVFADDGTEGYVYSSELAEAEGVLGEPSAANLKKWGDGLPFITVYDSSGTFEVGTFTFSEAIVEADK